MEEGQQLDLFDMNRLLMGEEIPYIFLFEVFVRSAVMFFIVLIILRLSGKRGIKQLSIFELAILISLGSAAGDPMFYQEVGLLPGIAVCLVIIVFYRMIIYLTGRFQKVEEFVEGKPVKLVEDGRIFHKALQYEHLACDELFSQLRLKNISHLGQIKHAYLETSGDISVFFLPDENVVPGLPILPEAHANPVRTFHLGVLYSCKTCGHTTELDVSKPCEVCNSEDWLESDRSLRTK